MQLLRSDCSSTPNYVDGTSSASGMPQTESTAPSGNMSSVLRNWTILIPTFPVSELPPRTSVPQQRER